MATSAPTISNSAPAVKVPLMSMLVICLLAAVLAIGGFTGALLYLARTGKLLAGGAASATSPVVAAKVQEVLVHNVALEPLLVNLADDDGHSYLRLGVVLAEETEKNAKDKEEKPLPGADAAARDAVLSVLGTKRAVELLAPQGKERLKNELKVALDREAPKAKVQAVYFTDFLVQR